MITNQNKLVPHSYLENYIVGLPEHRHYPSDAHAVASEDDHKIQKRINKLLNLLLLKVRRKPKCTGVSSQDVAADLTTEMTRDPSSNSIWSWGNRVSLSMRYRKVSSSILQKQKARGNRDSVETKKESSKDLPEYIKQPAKQAIFNGLFTVTSGSHKIRPKNWKFSGVQNIWRRQAAKVKLQDVPLAAKQLGLEVGSVTASKSKILATEAPAPVVSDLKQIENIQTTVNHHRKVTRSMQSIEPRIHMRQHKRTLETGEIRTVLYASTFPALKYCTHCLAPGAKECIRCSKTICNAHSSHSKARSVTLDPCIPLTCTSCSNTHRVRQELHTSAHARSSWTLFWTFLAVCIQYWRRKL